MANTIHIQVEDIEDKLLLFDQIEVERSISISGTYVNIGNIALTAGDYNYELVDLNGSNEHFYRYRFSLSGGNPTDYSDPFRMPGITRKDIRQFVLKTYRAGMVFNTSGGDTNTVTTNDYRVKSSQYRVGRGMGQWLYPTEGVNAGLAAMIATGSNPALGSFELEVAWPNAIVADTQVEWHYLIEPDMMNDLINEALKRYWYIDTIAIQGVPEQGEYDLANYAPWIKTRQQIHSLWYYPHSEAVLTPWGSLGSWWNIRQDAHSFKLLIHPTIDATQTLYIETTRNLPELLEDDASVPEVANIDLIAAFVWDEMLTFLSRPMHGTAEDTKAWDRQRVIHSQGKLTRLIAENTPRPRPGLPPTSYPDTTVSRAKAR